jgi:hypothetical protein
LLYRAPLQRTKSTSPIPGFGVTGTLTVDGEAIDLTGWTGMLGHNWGSQHAACWVWLRASGLGGDGWLDAVVGRVRVGRWLTPWTAFGMLALPGGERVRLGGLGNRGTVVAHGEADARIKLTGKDTEVETQVTVPLASTVGWAYSDPTGEGHEVVNCSVAQTRVTVTRNGREELFEPERRGVLELGAARRAFDVPLQPFAD